MQERNFDQESRSQGERRYLYDFDDFIRGYALRTFQHLLQDGPVLELGCHEGGMTRYLAERFSDLTVVDASQDALDVAQSQVPARVQFVHGTFEAVSLSKKYESIFLINVLEHVDDSIQVLRRISDWLTESGRIFIVVPNANAPSRQIAVRMGLVTHNQAVTDAESKTGHRRTYALDTLERDLKEASLRIEQIGGLVFKGLANYQMDRALGAGIISTQYLDACYELGKIYPDLTASLYAVCSR